MFTALEAYQHQFNDFLANNSGAPIYILVALGFFGGLISSLLPCVLSLLPINLAYIGTLKVDCRKQAFTHAAQFVLGVALVMSLLGLSAGFAFAVFTEYKAPINIAIGLLITLMAFSLAGIFKFPIPQFITKVPEASPFVVGLTFALISSPCSSPVLVSVVSIAAGLGSLVKSMMLMFAYSLGYTAIIFVASLFAGLAKYLHWFKLNSDLFTRISAIILGIFGLFYLYVGIKGLL
ncbi:MAG: cytochrome c biogenesis protein CcdA [Candidatus Melainabacteria bacterium]|nr:cytochrome c biogenesis protein CcdA [Candidatus Melainabacteria bacterium]